MNSDCVSPSASAVGIIGMGLMGSALRLRIGAEYGWDLNSDRSLNAANADMVFTHCGIIFLCLPDAAASGEVLRGAALRPGQTVVDTSTGDPGVMAALGAELAVNGVGYLDATISGNSVQLSKGEVIVMAGGDVADFERCRDLFARFSREAIHVGPCGSGAKMKLVTNLVLGLNRAALAEGLVLGEQLGLDPAMTLELMRRGAAYSRIMDAKGEKMIARDYTPQAKLSQHLKDVRLILAASGVPLPLSEAHRVMLEKAVEMGFGEADNSAIIEAILSP